MRFESVERVVSGDRSLYLFVSLSEETVDPGAGNRLMKPPRNA